MTIESFPRKKKGDPLGAGHVNRLGDAIMERVIYEPSSGFAGKDGRLIGEPRFTQRLMIITRVHTVDDDAEDSDEQSGQSSQSSQSSSSEAGGGWTCGAAKYECRPRYFDFDDNTWKTDGTDGPYCLDSSEFGDDLEEDDIVEAWWDNQRGCFIGGAIPGSQTNLWGIALEDWNDASVEIRIVRCLGTPPVPNISSGEILLCYPPNSIGLRGIYGLILSAGYRQFVPMECAPSKVAALEAVGL